MLTHLDLAHTFSLLSAVYDIMQAGIIISAVGCIYYGSKRSLSNYTRFGEPDLTFFQRRWTRFYDSYFRPIGEQAIDEQQDLLTNQILFQVTVGGVVLFTAVGVYLLSSTALLGAAFVSGYWFGLTPEVSHLFEPVAALCLIVGMAVIFHTDTTVTPSTPNNWSADE